MIKLERVSYAYYDKFPAVSDVSLEINRGDKVAIIGANGCGKSTLLQIMGGLRYPSEGRFLFGGL